MAIKILIDSASDITIKEAESLGINMIPLTVYFGEEAYLDGVDLFHDEFYHKLEQTKGLPKTSQITPIKFEKEFKRLTANGNQVLVITISSKLSGTYSSAVIASSEFEGQVYVVDSGSAAVGERILYMHAKKLIDEGMGIEDIVNELNEIKKQITIIAVVDTLEYLKKGGRISSTVAFAGELLSIKPILCVRDGEIEMIGKSLGSKKANKLLNKLITNIGGIDYDMPYGVLWSGYDDTNIKKYISESSSILLSDSNVPTYILGCAIGTHVGPGVIGVAFFKKDK